MGERQHCGFGGMLSYGQLTEATVHIRDSRIDCISTNHECASRELWRCEHGNSPILLVVTYLTCFADFKVISVPKFRESTSNLFRKTTSWNHEPRMLVCFKLTMKEITNEVLILCKLVRASGLDREEGYSWTEPGRWVVALNGIGVSR